MTNSSRLVARIQQDISEADLEQLLAVREKIDRLQEAVEERWAEQLRLHALEPWEAYHAMRLIFACSWIARTYSILGGILASEPSAPSVTRTQAVLFLVQLDDCAALLQRSLNLRLGSSTPIPPMTLGPRVQDERTPLAHLRALMAALDALRAAAGSELDRYSGYVAVPDSPVWVKIIDRRLRAELANAEMGVNLARGFVTAAAETPDRAPAAEDLLWSSLETHIWLGQIISAPSLLDEVQTGRELAPLIDGPWIVEEHDAHCLTPIEVQNRLEAAGLMAQLDEELHIFWETKGWRLSADEQRFLVDVAELKRNGAIHVVSYIDEAPYNEVWVAEQRITLGNRYVLPDAEFTYDHRHGHDRIVTELERPLPT